MIPSKLSPIRRIVAGTVLVLALAAAGCGSNPSHTKTSPPPASSGGSSGGSSGSSGGSSSSGIPQGANAGDADSDNHGGPSDGDGNI